MTSRRQFLRSSIGVVAAGVSPGARPHSEAATRPPGPPRIRFAAIGLNHSHIGGEVEAVLRGGGELVSFYAKEPELAGAFAKRYPAAKPARTEREILDDPTIALVASASVPSERAPLGVDVMRHGKDFLVDKPGATTLEQLAEVRRVQAQTGRIYSVLVERHESKTITRAGELVRSGAIGRVFQTVGLAPHRMAPASRPPWFFDRQKYGGILCDLASHNIDAYLFFTGSTRAQVAASQVANVDHPEYPGLEDFGDVILRGDGGMGYIRVDWFTPGGISSFGDGRLTILGTDGFIELRKNVDLGGRPGGNHLFLVDQKQTRYIDCSDTVVPFGTRLVDDVLNRTETAGAQAGTFLAMQLGIEAETRAERVVMSGRSAAPLAPR
jgi:predicted dehydrogenase